MQMQEESSCNLFCALDQTSDRKKHWTNERKSKSEEIQQAVTNSS